MLVCSHGSGQLSCFRTCIALGQGAALGSMDPAHSALSAFGAVHFLDNEEIGERYQVIKCKVKRVFLHPLF